MAAAVAAAVAEAEATVESQSRQKRRASPVQRKVHSKARQVNASNEGRVVVVVVVVVVGMKRGRRRKEGKKSRLKRKRKIVRLQTLKLSNASEPASIEDQCRKRG